MNREDIIKQVIANRNSLAFLEPIETCPFMANFDPEKCKHYCEKIFPRYRKEVIYRQIVLHNDCPCDFYSKKYVRHRMKKLFPELYNGGTQHGKT